MVVFTSWVDESHPTHLDSIILGFQSDAHTIEGQRAVRQGEILPLRVCLHLVKEMIVEKERSGRHGVGHCLTHCALCVMYRERVPKSWHCRVITQGESARPRHTLAVRIMDRSHLKPIDIQRLSDSWENYIFSEVKKEDSRKGCVLLLMFESYGWSGCERKELLREKLNKLVWFEQSMDHLWAAVK